MNQLTFPHAIKLIINLLKPNMPNQPTDGDRKWDQQFEAWKSMGCPNDDPSHPVPGPHPDKNHPWEIDPKAYCK